jgi:prepilin-type processing-associated H-X9-DG protein
MGIALHNYLDRHKSFPTSGEGLVPAMTSTGFDVQSCFTMILPFVDGGDIYSSYDLSQPYNATAGNKAVAQTVIPTYLCPNNPTRPSSGRDSLGYGYTDYMPVAYTDINPSGIPGDPVKLPKGSIRAHSGLRLGGTKPGDIIDGLSKTIAMMEDVGRSETFNTQKYADPIGTDLLPAGSTFRNAWRWAEPDSANGVSGPPGAVYGQAGLKVINNNATPYGGPPAFPWTTSECGPNDEPFSFHGGGCNCVFMDGHVTFIRDTINPVALRYLITSNEGIPPVDGDY